MPGLPPPLLLALIPSEVVHCDPFMRYSALNFLSVIQQRLPAPSPRKIGIFVALTAVRYRVQVNVDLITPDGTTLEIFSWDLNPTSFGPLDVHQSGGNVGVVFTAHGSYCFRASANGNMLGEWGIQVVP